MSRLSNTFTKHKKDNYSLDIKGIYKTGMQTPFGKKKDNDSHPYFFKLKTQIQTQVAHNTSMQLSDKQIGYKQKRRFSLNKTFKMNNSVGIENHLSRQKIKRINQLMSQNKFDQCLQIIRQLLIRQQNQFIKNKLFWLNAICLEKVGKIKQAEHFLTRLLNEEQDNYQALIKRASIRYNLGAKELSVRDYKYAIYVNPKKQQAYVQLCNMFLVEGDNKYAYNSAHAAIEKDVQSIQLFLIIIQILLTDRNISQLSQKKAQFYIQKLTKNIGKNTKNSADFQYLQALQFQQKQKYTQACIYYQQCLKYNNSTYSVTKSLQRLILIKITQRDYYSAYHTVNRYKILNIQAKIIQPYIMFLQGVILIMKKKFNDGIKVFDILLEVIKNNSISEKNQIHLQMLFKQFIQCKGIKEKQKNYKDNKEKQKQKQKQKQKDKDPKEKQKEKQKGKILAFSHIHYKCRQAINALMLKFNSYASFKLGNHQKCIQYYQRLVDFGMDECSSYNLLLAQGIIAVQKKKNFQLGMQKFEQARYVYPCKVQPSIYIAMTVIYRDLCISGMNVNPNNQSQSLTSAIIHAMQELNQAHQTINNSSSNLLFHRCILNLYMQEWHTAMNDINLCIQKAEQNEPKYFYLRGLCYAVVKDLKKAINQYSISLSLNPDYIKSLLQRSKCYFLLGQTQSGFSDLKQYMYKNQNDYFVHKWIGDLLYQGKSYSDAYKAYSQIDQSLMFQAEIMKCKCLIRTTDLNKVSDCLTKLSKLEQCNQNMLQVDILAVTLLKQLIKPHQIKDTTTKIKKLNSLLQENCVGYIFGLIDCMNLLGIATFDAGRYEQAYESFLLVLQLYGTLAQKNKSQLKSDCSEQGLSLTLQDIYLNITFSLIGMKDVDSAARIMSCQLISCTATQKCESRITSVLQKYSKQESNGETMIIQPDFLKNQKIRLKEFVLKMKHIKIKFCPVFSLFHTCVEDLYSKSVTRKMIKDLKPSYIDNMPEGPWIKRNQHGVIFTDQVFQNSISSDFLSSMRAKQSSDASQQASRRIEHEEEDDQFRKRQQFKKKMLLDKQIERKLDKIIKKTNQ